MKHDTLRIRQLRRKGYTYEQIREKAGCCNETIRRALADDIDAFREKENRRLRKWRKQKEVDERRESRFSRIASMEW